MVKTILISHISLPSEKIGSWTTLYKNYLTDNHQIDYIICDKPKDVFPNIKYEFLKNSFFVKIKQKLYKNRQLRFTEALSKIIKPNEKYIIQIIDNYKLASEVANYIKSKNLRKYCYVQFFYHGYLPLYDKNKGTAFFESIDEMIFLTEDSSKTHKNYYNSLPCRFSVLHNGIDTSKFRIVETVKKEQFKKEFGVIDKKIFVWCAQDRPKKGLFIILNVWKRIYNQHKNVELWVIGTPQKQNIRGVKFIGRIPNDDLPKYYQSGDVYLFPTLCQEGFGLSLIEAKHCGCYCIASDIGGVPEVLEYGKYGKLIKNPHFISEWVDAINDYLKNEYKDIPLPEALYTSKQWNAGMDKIITEAKLNLNE